MAQELSGLRIAILASDLFEEAELVEPREALDSAGADTVVIAPHEGSLRAAEHDEPTDTHVKVDELLEDADPEEYDGVLLPGGVVNADHLRINEDAQAFVRAMQEAGKPLGVICHGPWLLVSAGLVRGRTLTSFPTLADDIENAGGTWVDEEVCVDHNWVSSRKPDDIPAFNAALIKLMEESKAQVS